MADSLKNRQVEDQDQEPAPPSPKEGIWLKVALAVVSFLLGLVANYLNTTVLADKRQGSYSVSVESLLTVSDNIPAELRVVDVGKPRQVSKFIVTVRNTGDLKLTEANALIEFPSQAEILKSSVATEPKREVVFTVDPQPSKHQLRVSKITLERGQTLMATLFVQSPKAPAPEIYLSGGGEKVEWAKAAAGGATSLRGHLEQILKYLILATIVPGLIAAIPNGIGMFMFGLFSENQKRAQKYFMIPMSVAQLMATLVKYYLLLKILPPGYEVIKYFT